MSQLRELLNKQMRKDAKKLEAVAKSVYDTGSVAYIEKFQTWIANIETLSREGKLESMVSLGINPVAKIEVQPQVLTTNLPVISTSEDYRKARDKGLNHEEVKKQYSIADMKKLPGFARGYNYYAKQLASKSPVAEKTSEVQPSKPELTRDKYFELREQGKTNLQIRQEYSVNPPVRLGGWTKSYDVLKRTGTAPVESVNRKSNASSKAKINVLSGELRENAVEDTRAPLDFGTYTNLKRQGYTEADILKNYKVTSQGQLNGFRMQYVKALKRETGKS